MVENLYPNMYATWETVTDKEFTPNSLHAYFF